MSFSIDWVRREWERGEEAKREAQRRAKKSSLPSDDSGMDLSTPADYDYRYVNEAYSDFLIVGSGGSSEGIKYKVPYVVQPNNKVAFGAEIPVKIEYVEMSDLSARERLDLAMGDVATGSTLVALAGTTNVESHVRHSSKGKLFRVKSYDRIVKPSDMSLGDVVKDSFGKQRTVESVHGNVVKFTDGRYGQGSFHLVSKATTVNPADGAPPQSPTDVTAKPRSLSEQADRADAGSPPAENSYKGTTSVPKKLDPKGDLVAQYKSGQGMFNSKGVDDFGRENILLMENEQLAEVRAWKAEQIANGTPGMSGASDLAMIDTELKRRTGSSPTDDFRDQKPSLSTQISLLQRDYSNAAWDAPERKDMAARLTELRHEASKERLAGMSDSDLEAERRIVEGSREAKGPGVKERQLADIAAEQAKRAPRQPVRWTPPPRTPVPLKKFGNIQHEDDTPVGTVAYPTQGGTASPYRYRKTAEGDWEPLKKEREYLGPHKGWAEYWVPSGGTHAPTLATTSGGGDANWRAEIVGDGTADDPFVNKTELSAAADALLELAMVAGGGGGGSNKPPKKKAPPKPPAKKTKPKFNFANAKKAAEKKDDSKSSGGSKNSDFNSKHPRIANGTFTYSNDSGSGTYGKGSMDKDKGKGRIGAAQAALVKAGFLAKDAGHNGKAVDGWYGNKTEAAVKKFQKAHKLEETGKIDAKTAKALGLDKVKMSVEDMESDVSRFVTLSMEF